jgi:hypothetical protein
MDPTAIFAFAAEALKTFNALYASEPVAERIAAGIVWWNLTKWLVYPLLTADQRRQVDAFQTSIPSIPTS